MTQQYRTPPEPVPVKQEGLARWNYLDGQRSGLMTRLESYASVTIPKLLLPAGQDQNNSSIQHDYTSVGAQAVNHLTNKIILALFRPGSPFFRLDLPKKKLQELMSAGISEDDLREVLVQGEQDALKVLDQKAIRPRLNEAVRNLVALGNVLLDLTGDDLITYSIRNYTVKRTAMGKPVEILIYQKVLRDELEDDIQASLPLQGKQAESYVEYVKQYRLRNKKWTLKQFVDNHMLGEDFTAEIAEKDFKLYPLTWDIAQGHDYGTGLVEDYAGDFGTLSTLSEAEIKMALLVSDYRWLANPSGVTDVADFKNTRTGDVIQGQKGDVELVSAASTGQALQYVSASVQTVVRRIGQAFLLGSAVTRQAERVTAEEIRLQAQELETSLGGVYSRLAVELQVPLSYWLLARVDIKVKGTGLIPTIVTGLDALSRNAEAQQLSLFLQDIAQVAQLGEQQNVLILSAIYSTMAAARGLNAKKFVKSPEQQAQEAEAQRAAETEQVAGQSLAQEGAKAIAQGPTEE